ncbi:MAG: CopG family transcriptional regulator [Planctomycetota bacterium]|nr:MAG: CopG family transcriptional regulator [Planctomycetota bacterium]REJ87974.1 MAG: CopG family transcriptional regulator [Planctomycetota bacterium]
MSLDLPADLSEFVERTIASGSYRDENELLVEGLRLLRTREQLRSDVDAGVRQLEAGEGIDGEEVFDRLLNRAHQIERGGVQ